VVIFALGGWFTALLRAGVCIHWTTCGAGDKASSGSSLFNSRVDLTAVTGHVECLKAMSLNPAPSLRIGLAPSSAAKTSVICLGARRSTFDSVERKPVFQRSHRAEGF